MENAYLVAVYSKVIDPEKMQNYGADALPAMMANGGKNYLQEAQILLKSKGFLLKGRSY